jgi:hypothetical protein
MSNGGSVSVADLRTNRVPALLYVLWAIKNFFLAVLDALHVTETPSSP